MAEVKIIDIDGEQWNIKDQMAREKIATLGTEIENLTSEINVAKRDLERFYYDSNLDRDVLQNRINAMIYCYNNSKSGIATIRYSEGYYHNVIMPSAELHVNPLFIEIEHSAKINVFRIRSNTDYELIRSI